MEKRKISSLKGIGEKTEKLFQKIGVDTVEDLIRYYPKGFEIFEDPISVGEVERRKSLYSSRYGFRQNSSIDKF